MPVSHSIQPPQLSLVHGAQQRGEGAVPSRATSLSQSSPSPWLYLGQNVFAGAPPLWTLPPLTGKGSRGEPPGSAAEPAASRGLSSGPRSGQGGGSPTSSAPLPPHTLCGSAMEPGEGDPLAAPVRGPSRAGPHLVTLPHVRQLTWKCFGYPKSATQAGRMGCCHRMKNGQAQMPVAQEGLRSWQGRTTMRGED